MDKSASMRETLKTYFGYDSFRPLQEEIIRHILEQTGCIGINAYWWGKSICYQLPCIAFAKVLLCRFPTYLIDERSVEALLANGIAAGALNSSNDETENVQLRRACVEGRPSCFTFHRKNF